MVYCAVFGCKTSNNKQLRVNKNLDKYPHSFFCFPRNLELQKQWVTFCGRKDHFNVKTSSVCSKHFSADFFIRDLQAELLNLPPKRKLKLHAIPTELGPKCKTLKSLEREHRLQRRKQKKYSDEIFTTHSVVSVPTVTDGTVIGTIGKGNMSMIETTDVTIGDTSLNKLQRRQATCNNTDIIDTSSTMKSNDTLKMSNICRGCLTEDGKLISIFDWRTDKPEPLKFNEMIMNFSNVKINETDGLPSKICNICIRKTIMAYTFMLQVQASEHTLRNYLYQSKSVISKDEVQKSGLIYLIDTGEKSESIIVNEASGIDNGIIEKREIFDILNEHISNSDFDAEIETKNVICEKKQREIKHTYQMKTKKSKFDKQCETMTNNQCQICKKQFPDPDSLKEHFIFCIKNPRIILNVMENSKISPRPGSCSECNVKFESSTELELHKKTMHDLSSTNNKLLTVKTLSSKNIYETVQPAIKISKHFEEREKNHPTSMESSIAKVDIKTFDCDICGAIFDTQESFKAHLILHARHGVTVCVYCLDTFESNSEMVAHAKLKHHPKVTQLFSHKHARVQFRCNYCDKYCRSKASLEVHIRTKHTKERALQCPFCPKRFIAAKELNRHRMGHQMQAFPCPICRKTFTTKSSLKIHIPKHSRADPERCLECGRTFMDDFQLKHHIKVVHSGETHECPTCLRVFSHISLLKNHQLSHNSEEQRRFKCPHCPKRFNYRHNLKNHETSHTGVRPFLCNICGKGFIQAHGLTVHLRQHQAVKPYACQLCEQTFSQRHTLMRHVRQHTGEKPFMCNLCGKFYSDKSTLDKHLKAHETVVEDEEEVGDFKIVSTVDIESSAGVNAGAKTNFIHITNRKKVNRYICKVCGKSFPSAITLGFHKRTHTCKYVCDICNRKFSLPITLELHRKSHTDKQRKYKHSCPECGINYRTPKHLLSHTRRVHSLDRPFNCLLCPAKFFQNGELNVHMRKHTGEKPYVCRYCHKGFTSSTPLAVHVRSHTGEKPYRCSTCPRAFSTSTGMIGHMKTHVPKSNEYTHADSNTSAQAKIYSDPITDLVNNSHIKDPITSSVNLSNVDSDNAVTLEGEFMQKKIYLVNEHDEVIEMETVASYDEDLNQYTNTENRVDATEYDNSESQRNMPNYLNLLESNVSEKNDAVSVNILRSVDGTFTLHLPGNMRLNDGDSLQIDMGNKINLGDGTHVLRLDQPSDLAGDLNDANLDDVACDENVIEEVAISSINF